MDNKESYNHENIRPVLLRIKKISGNGFEFEIPEYKGWEIAHIEKKTKDTITISFNYSEGIEVAPQITLKRVDRLSKLKGDTPRTPHGIYYGEGPTSIWFQTPSFAIDVELFFSSAAEHYPGLDAKGFYAHLIKTLQLSLPDAGQNNRVEIKIPSPFNLELTLDLGFPLDRFETKLGKKPWVPVCQGSGCEIYVGDRNAMLPGYSPIMFPCFVKITELDPKLISDQKKLTDFIRSLDPGFFGMKVKVKNALSNKINAKGTSLLLIDCRLEGGDPERFQSHIIVKSPHPLLISHHDEVDVDSIRQLDQPPPTMGLTLHDLEEIRAAAIKYYETGQAQDQKEFVDRFVVELKNGKFLLGEQSLKDGTVSDKLIKTELNKGNIIMVDGERVAIGGWNIEAEIESFRLIRYGDHRPGSLAIYNFGLELDRKNSNWTVKSHFTEKMRIKLDSEK